jgi:hypothetical protein
LETHSGHKFLHVLLLWQGLTASQVIAEVVIVFLTLKFLKISFTSCNAVLPYTFSYN